MKKTAYFFLLVLVTFTSLFSPLAEAQTIDLNATVPAKPTDFSATLESLTPGTSFSQNTTLSYEITYGSTLSYPSNITVQAQWSRGTVLGDSTPTVDILEYSIGSASNGYNNSAPVIDTVNRTITWTIFSFPGNTQNQKVTFDLKTTDAYTGDSEINFTVTGRLLAPGTTTHDSTVTQKYLYDTSPVPTPTTEPTTPPQAGTTPTPTTTLTPTPPLTQNTFTSLAIRNVTHQNAAVFTATSLRSSVTLLYGTSPVELNKRVISSPQRTSHLLTLTDLTPHTQYYFQIQASDNTGTIYSDIFTFTTADLSQKPLPSLASVVVTSGNTILYNNPTFHKDNIFTLMLPTSTTYTLRLNLTESDAISDITLISRDQSTEQEELRSAMSELQKGIYQGRLQSPTIPTHLALIARITTTDGSIQEKSIGNVVVVQPMTIINKRTQESIEGARVQLSFWNEREKRFVPLSSNIIPYPTLFSDVTGVVPIVLPEGHYQAEISHLGFAPRNVTFFIGGQPEAGYPTVELKETSFNILAFMTYLTTIINDIVGGLTGEYLNNLTSSVRFYHLLAASSLLTLSLLTLLSLFSRTKLTPALLPVFLLYHVTRQNTAGTVSLSGTVIDHETSRPIASANIYVFTKGTETILAHTVTSVNGTYTLKNITKGDYRITILKTGYLPFEVHKNLAKDEKSILHFGLSHKEQPVQVVKNIWHNAESFFSFSFEVWLLLSFILLTLVGMSIGWEKILGFLAIAFFNLTIWSLHRKRVAN